MYRLVVIVLLSGCAGFFPPHATDMQKACLSANLAQANLAIVAPLADGDLALAQESLVGCLQSFVTSCREKGLLQ